LDRCCANGRASSIEVLQRVRANPFFLSNPFKKMSGTSIKKAPTREAFLLNQIHELTKKTNHGVDTRGVFIRLQFSWDF
jgi:hypothetical protein